MKRVYVWMLGAALGAFSASAQADSEIKVTYENNQKAGGFDFFQGGTKLSQDVAAYSDGHMTVSMAEASGKYRADLWYNNGKSDKYFKTVTPSKTAVMAIKFIGDKPNTPANSFQLEWLGDGISGKKNPTGNITTTNGNKIYYWDLYSFTGYSAESEATQIQRYHFIIADCTVGPFEYTVDWICTFESVEALTDAKDWKDDGENDMDEYVAPKVMNETTGIGYQDLGTAWSEADSGAVLNVLENQTIVDLWAKKTVDGTNVAREITVKGDGEVVITRKSGHNGLLFCSGMAGCVINLEDVVIDGGEVSGAGVSIEASGNGVVNMKNVTLRGMHSTNNQGVVSMKSGGRLTLENVVAEGCVVPDGKGEVFCGTNNLTLKGDNTVSVYIEKLGKIKAENIGNKSRIKLYAEITKNRINNNDMAVVNGYANANRFELAGYTIATDSGVDADAKYDLVAVNGNIELCDMSVETYAPVAPMINWAETTSVELEVKDGDVLHIAGVKGCHVWYKEYAIGDVAMVAVADAVVNKKEDGWKEVEADEFDYVVPGDIKSVEFKSVKNEKHSEIATLTIPGGSTGVEGVEASMEADGDVEWFTLQGVRIAQPEDGIYIRRQGNKVEKVVVR